MVDHATILADRQSPLGLLLLGKLFDHAERAAVILLRLRIGIDLGRVAPRFYQVGDGAPEIPAALEMHGKLRRDARGLIAVMPEQLLSRLTVQLRPAFAD